MERNSFARWLRMSDLSIIIPIFNAERYLNRCLDSVRSLKNDVEIILIDDGSYDRSVEICDLYASKDKRFRVIHKENEGLVLSRKRGIDEVTTKYFTFIDADDYIDSGMYDKMIGEIIGLEFDVDVVCVGMTEEYMGKIYTKINDYSEGVFSGNRIEELVYNMLSKGEFFNFGILPNAVCKIYRTDFYINNPINVCPDVSVGEDADMTFQLMVRASNICIFNMTPYHYCRRDDSMMWKKIDPKAIENLEQDLKKAFIESRYDEERLLNQLVDYIDFVSLLCNPAKLLRDDFFFSSKKDRIALYGAGGVGKALRYGMDNIFSLWVDKNYKKYSDENIVAVERLIDDQDCYDKIFIAIANVNTCQLIKDSLVDRGINKPIYYYRCKDNR